jgi:hypothetical protein
MGLKWSIVALIMVNVASRAQDASDLKLARQLADDTTRQNAVARILA